MRHVCRPPVLCALHGHTPAGAPIPILPMTMPRLALTLVAFFLLSPAAGQQLDVTIRYLSDGTEDNAFVPGTFNSWGQPYNSNGCIAPLGPSQMEYVRFQAYWRKKVALTIGSTYQYKIQVHRNPSGTSCDWLTDPLNPEVNDSDNNNSILRVTDPMAFQVAEELTAQGTVRHFSAGLFSTSPIATITFEVNGVSRTDGMDFFDADNGIFRYPLDRELRSGAQFAIEATDMTGRAVSAEIGQIQAPVEWATPAFTTVEEDATLRGFITRLDGSIDPDLTMATAVRGDGQTSFVPVTSGQATVTVPLDMGANEFRLRAEVDGQSFDSDPVVVTRRLHPLHAYAVTSTVSGSNFQFQVDLTGTQNLPSDFSATWSLDQLLSTSTATSWSGTGLRATGVASGPGELYLDVDITSRGQKVDQLRVAVKIESDGTARTLEYAETADWINRAVVYEIFALQFGPTSNGSVTNPGSRLKQITAELDYIAGMGFNTIWFMPIMRNRNGMTPLGAGYNIIDFYTVDERLGTNQDFAALVDRAHELGIRVVLDLTPNHVSPDHPWTNSLREDGPYSDYIQTTPSAHNRGQDGRGPNLAEIWQVENGRDLYRKYDGFGDLANLNWDDDDLQAEMLDVMAYWLNEYDIDGFRMDVWWGPIRRYGVGRFGRPVREVIRRQRPDAWILGEIAGTGGGTEVYYADDDRGTAVEGGIDAGYDWSFYHEGVRSSFFPNVPAYDSRLQNGGFWPGPNARYFRFLENHDEPRIATLRAPDEVKALTGMLLTTTGIPMIYAGQEVNFGTGSGDTRRTAVSWNTTRNGAFAALHQRLALTRTSFPAFWTQDLTRINATGSSRVYAYVRPLEDQNAVVVVNFNATPTTVSINPSTAVRMSTDGPVPYYDIYADTSGAYLGEFSLTVPGFETVVYITDSDPGFQMPARPPDLPYNAVYTATESMELPERVTLDPAYPNPFNPTTRIAFGLPESGPVRLQVFDMLGRRVATLADGVMAPGRHEVTFHASGLPSGTYLYRLETAARVTTRTMVLVK